VTLFGKRLPYSFEGLLVFLILCEGMIFVVVDVIDHKTEHFSELFFIKSVSTLNVNGLKESEENSL
jgi:hypothetical protein